MFVVMALRKRSVMKQDHQIQNFDVDDILEALEADRNSGSLPDIVTRSVMELTLIILSA